MSHEAVIATVFFPCIYRNNRNPIAYWVKCVGKTGLQLFISFGLMQRLTLFLKIKSWKETVSDLWRSQKRNKTDESRRWSHVLHVPAIQTTVHARPRLRPRPRALRRINRVPPPQAFKFELFHCHHSCYYTWPPLCVENCPPHAPSVLRPLAFPPFCLNIRVELSGGLTHSSHEAHVTTFFYTKPVYTSQPNLVPACL